MFYAIRKFGWREVWRQWRVHSWFRGGELVGTDAAGNRYYQVRDPHYYQHGKDRYVEYNLQNIQDGGRADGSMVPPHWHGWLHHTHDEVPTEAELSKYPWLRGAYKENLTGTDAAYKPAPTVPPKIGEFK